MVNIVKYIFIGIVAIIFICFVGIFITAIIPVIIGILYLLCYLLIPIGIAIFFWGLGKIIVWVNKTSKMENNNQGGN